MEGPFVIRSTVSKLSFIGSRTSFSKEQLLIDFHCTSKAPDIWTQSRPLQTPKDRQERKNKQTVPTHCCSLRTEPNICCPPFYRRNNILYQIWHGWPSSTKYIEGLGILERIPTGNDSFMLLIYCMESIHFSTQSFFSHSNRVFVGYRGRSLKKAQHWAIKWLQ